MARYIKRSPTGICFGASSLHYIYINIDDQINSRLLKFADDTKIYFEVNSPENIERLREDLCKLVSWSKEWQMLFNVEKCKVMHRGACTTGAVGAAAPLPLLYGGRRGQRNALSRY